MSLIDREKVIKGLECCSFAWNIHEPPNCKNCPYADAEFGTCQIPNTPLIDDAIALLMEQEPVKVVRRVEETEWNVCSNCGNHMISKWKWCPYCGRAVKWDE